LDIGPRKTGFTLAIFAKENVEISRLMKRLLLGSMAQSKNESGIEMKEMSC
jgi:hypothetical protein